MRIVIPPTGENGGDLWFLLCLSVSQSHFSGSCDNFKSSSYFFMKLEIMDRWQYGDYARHFILFLRQEFWLLWQQID